ncbi:MAG: hypothetical protein D6816_02880 [Bacteroidetes bacterium]|nr:MAG: hypothetical protein D6816_02880 [Bacteroidota bacterium]
MAGGKVEVEYRLPTFTHDLSNVEKDLIEKIKKYVYKRQFEVVASEGRSVGKKWPDYSPLTQDWKEAHDLPEDMLVGRTGRLIESIKKPETRVDLGSASKLTINIGRGIRNERGVEYARFVREGWQQNVSPTHATGLFFKEGIRVNPGTILTGPPREIVGFKRRDIERFVEEEVNEMMRFGPRVKRFIIKKINFVKKLFKW